MKVQSNTSTTSQQSQKLKSLCNGIGKTTITCGGQTNLAAVKAVMPLLSQNNATYMAYKSVLDSDSQHISSIGFAFREFDTSLMRSFK